MLYLRMIACWLEHTRLFIEVYKNNTRRVKMSVSSPPKEEAQEEKKRKNRLKRAECEKRDPSLYTANRSSLRLRNRMETISTRVISLRTPFAQIRRAFGSSSRRHPRSSWGLGSRTRRKKRHKTKRKKSLSSHSETEHRPRTKLDRLWRYLSGETPTRLQSPFLCVDVRVYVRNQQQIE